MTMYTFLVTLVLVMDPFGNIPVFIAQLNGIDPRRRRHILVRELLIALAVLTVFLFFGQAILSGLQISQSSLQIAGGVVLFLIALRMIFPLESAQSSHDSGASRREPFIVPLAVPLVAGPSAMAYVILVSTQFPDQRAEWMLALGIAWAITAIVLLLADRLAQLLGPQVLLALERLMGMILTTIAVQMLLGGLKSFLQG